MTQEEFNAILTRLRKKHGEKFKRWYETANYPDIEHYCEIGFLLSRFNPFEKEET
jgi:hypothetical protein